MVEIRYSIICNDGNKGYSYKTVQLYDNNLFKDDGNRDSGYTLDTKTRLANYIIEWSKRYRKKNVKKRYFSPRIIRRMRGVVVVDW